jgi:hypothetical protein
MATTATPTTGTTTTKVFPLKFVLIAFAFTWAFWLLAVLEARGLISSLPVPALFLGAFGPMVAAVVLTAQEGGRAGLRSLLSRVVRWRVAPFWVFLVFLLPFAFLYTWIFNSTGGSVLMAMILHAVTNASSGPLWRATAEYSTTVSSTNVYLIQAALLWVGAIILVLVYGATNLSRKPKQVLVAATRGELQPRIR